MACMRTTWLRNMYIDIIIYSYACNMTQKWHWNGRVLLFLFLLSNMYVVRCYVWHDSSKCGRWLNKFIYVCNTTRVYMNIYMCVSDMMYALPRYLYVNTHTYVRVCAYTNTRLAHTHTYTHTHTHTHTIEHTHTHTHPHAHTHTHTHTYTHIHIHIHTHIHTYIYSHMYLCTHT